MEPRGDLVALSVVIRHAREERGWTQPELASQAGVTARTVMNVELGRHAATIDTLLDIAHALGLRLSDILASSELGDDYDQEGA